MSGHDRSDTNRNSLNRAMRRHPRPPREPLQDNLEPPSEKNPAYGTSEDAESYAGRPDQGIVHTTGPGTGGATQPDGRITRHSGTHMGNRSNG